MYLKSLLQKERPMVALGHLALRFVETISKRKTVRAIISGCLNVRRIVPILILTLMFAPCLMNGAGSQISANAIDYSQPYNVVPNYLRLMGAASTFTIENDWIQTSAYRNFTGEVDISSVRVSAVGSDNYGTKYEKWLSIYINGGQYSGRLIYDSGWTTGDIDDNVLAFTSDISSVRIVYRLRYSDTTANPPNVNYLNNATVIIYYNSLEQIPADTTAIPNGWTVDTTVSQSTYATYPTVTTTISSDDVGNLVDSYSPVNFVWFGEQLSAFGSVTGWIITDFPWILALICWFLICSIIYWLLK